MRLPVITPLLAKPNGFDPDNTNLHGKDQCTLRKVFLVS
ncbi:hypothetical protein ANAEL_05799 [Anaerolineales bacterium]|nr:hypothetical protein ANAEL_05799 [Anaerolineales bacterium]